MTIDVHTHVVPADFPAHAGRSVEARWPSMQACDHPHHRTVMVGDKAFRTVSDHAWDVRRRLEDMDREGVTAQALSPMPELLSYWFSVDDAEAMADHVNGIIAEMVAREPERFHGLGMVPLQDPERAARYASDLRRRFGLVGVEVGTNINGRPIGDPHFDPFFAAAEQGELAIFVHALHPAGADRVLGPPLLQALVAFPNENAFAVASVVTGGLLDRYPKLRIGFSHGGGGFALVLPRLEFGWRATREQGAFLPDSPTAYARRLYYDALVYDDAALAYLLQVVGETQLMAGSDYPFAIRELAPGERFGRLGLDAAGVERLRTGNALRFLGV